MKSGIRVLVLGLVLVSVGCFSTEAPSFKNTAVAAAGSSSSSSASSSSSKSWRSAQLIDLAVLDSSTANQNVEGGASNLFYAPAILSGSARDFSVVFNRVETAGGTDPLLYATSPASFIGDSWATSLALFTRLDSVINTSTDYSYAPFGISDGNGDGFAIFKAVVSGVSRLLAVRRYVITSTYDIATIVSNSATSVTAYRLGVDGLNNNTVIVWCRNSNAYFNEYRSFSGWRAAPPTETDWDNGNACTGTYVGTDVAINSSGTGFGGFVVSNTTVAVRNWASDNWTATVNTTTGTSPIAYPCLTVDSSGVGTLFYWSGVAGGEAELYQGLSSGSFAGSRFDGSVGSGNVIIQSNNDVMEPIVDYKGDYAAVGFIKLDGVGGTQRLYVSRYSGGTWGTPEAVDDGAGDVTWASISVNAAGQIAVAYSVEIGCPGGSERVYANVYRSGGWIGAGSVDSHSSLSFACDTYLRPAAKIDADGNVLVAYSAYTSSSVRRVLAVSYR